MAVPYSEINSITQKYFVPKLVDNIFNSNALWQRGRKKFYNSLDGGTSIMEPVAYAATSASGWYSGSESLDISANDQVTSAEHAWKQIYASVLINRLDELKNSGKSQVVDFVKSKIQLAEKTIADNLGTAMFNDGTDSKALVGLRSAVSSGRTYGGIDSSTYSWWDAQVDASTTVLSLPALQALYGDCSIDNDKPTVGILTQDLYDDIWGLYQPAQRFTSEDTAKGGFTNLLFNGIPMIVDSHCPAGYLYMLNEDYMSIKYHKDENFRTTPFERPVNQNVSYMKIFWTGAFTINNPRMQGVMTSIA